jgi:hypothetical protein
MALASRRILEYPFHSRLSRLACLALGLALLWFGSGQLTVAGLMLMFSGLVIAVSAVQPPQPCFRLADSAAYYSDQSRPRRRPNQLATPQPAYQPTQQPSNPATQ